MSCAKVIQCQREAINIPTNRERESLPGPKKEQKFLISSCETKTSNLPSSRSVEYELKEKFSLISPSELHSGVQCIFFFCTQNLSSYSRFSFIFVSAQSQNEIKFFSKLKIKERAISPNTNLK